MIIRNNRTYDMFLGWVGKTGRMLYQSPGTLDIDDSYSQHPALRSSVASGDISVTAFTAASLDYVVQDEISGGGGEQERSGVIALPLGTSTLTVAFLPIFSTTTYSITYSFVNNIDVAPLHRTCMFKNLTVGGFDVIISNVTETANYILHWMARDNI